MARSLRFTCNSIALLLVLTGGALAQSPRSRDLGRTVIAERRPPREIPAATLPCTSEEAKWWEELRKAAHAVQESRGRKERDKFLDLLQQGQDKSYQPPIPDTKTIVLNKAFPSYSDEARRKRVSGSVILEVELRPDGFVGDVRIVRGLGHGLDERAADAARLTTFLPPVKDRKFTAFRLQMMMSFDIY